MFFHKFVLVALVGCAAAKPARLAKAGAPFGKLAHIEPIDRSPKSDCGASFDTEFGEFSSPNYPDIYPKNITDCGYTINSPVTDGTVRLRFVDFSTEETNDVVKVYNGVDASTALIATLSGSNLLEAQTVVTGSGSSLFVSFTTDSSVNGRGFLAQWSAACGNRFSSQNGNIESPAYPAEYADNLNLCYEIAAADDNIIRLQFADVDTEVDTDVIKVYDGDSEAAALLGTLSGQVLGEVFYSSARNLYVTFESNTGVAGKGFSASYSQLQVCGNRFGGPSGTITHPGYPSSYGNDLDACYLIEVAEGKTIQLNFETFLTEANFDVLTIYDGESSTAPLLVELSGSAAGTTVTSSGNALYLTFKSDYSYTYPGFVASYTEV